VPRGRGRAGTVDYWPGFVDALTTLVLVFTFLLVVFVLAQVVLNHALFGKNEAIDRLNRQVSELGDLLALERQASAALRLDVAQLSGALQGAVQQRDELSQRLGEAQRLASDLERRASVSERVLQEAERLVQVGRDGLSTRLKDLLSLQADIEALRRLRAELETKVGGLADALLKSEREAGVLRDRTKALESRLAGEEERTQLAQRELKDKSVRLEELLRRAQELEAEGEAERKLGGQQQQQIDLLSRQIAVLREELQRLNAALLAAEVKDKDSKAQIADLGQRLNRALASRVEELSRYRSEFFGKLREVLGNRRDIQIVGDRFVFQSEVLFDPASAELGEAGRREIGKLARTLIDIARVIPPEIKWILRIDGHTDRRPIATARFPSNWELSTARAIAVARFMQEQGLPPDRLAATGFAEFQPLDDHEDEIAYRRNRRIEFKLTER